jgi:hypothetical protein
MIDEFVDYARHGNAAEFARNLGHDVRKNPLPITLIGAGIAWLLMSNGRSRRSSSRSPVAEASENFSDRAASFSERARGAVDQVSDRVKRAAYRARSELSGTASSAYQSGSQRTADAAARMRENTEAFGETLSDTSQNLIEFCKNQPLVVAGIGMALGAALGALLPTTESENRLMGGTSDKALKRARRTAAESHDPAKASTQPAEQSQAEAGLQGHYGVQLDEEFAGHAGTEPSSHESATTVPTGDEAHLDNQRRQGTRQGTERAQ